MKPRRRVECRGSSGEPIGLDAFDARRQQRTLAALRLAPDLHDDARALVRRSAAHGQERRPLLANIDQHRVETGSEVHDPAKMDAAGRMDIPSLDMQFGGDSVFGPDNAPLARAGADQQIASHRSR